MNLSNTELQALVRRFNALPRKSRAPSGVVDNHWQFAVHHVSLEPQSDLLLIANPQSRYQHIENAGQVIIHKTYAEKAKIVVTLLLSGFDKGMGMGGPPGFANEADIDKFAPWSWGTDDEELAKAMVEFMKSVGVRRELCKIETGNQEAIRIQKECWEAVWKSMSQMLDLPKCGVCQKPRSPELKLMLCGRCKKVSYCSKECQKADWKNNHMSICKFPVEMVGNVSKLNSLDYFKTAAPKSPDAQALAREIGLTLPGPNSPPQGILYPIRRLVLTGRDTPANIELLLGPNDKDSVQSAHESMRFDALLDSPKGSPNYCIVASQDLDKNCPPRKIRPPSQAESITLEKIKDMQARIKRKMDSRGSKQVGNDDMTAILMSFGNRWDEAAPIYEHAINAMDQDVPVRRGN